MVQRAIERGELPKSTDAQLIVHLVSAPVQRALLFNEQLNASYVERVIDFALAGAGAVDGNRAVPARRSGPMRRRSR